MRWDNLHHAMRSMHNLSTCIIKNDSGYAMDPYSFVRIGGASDVSTVDGGTAGTDLAYSATRIDTNQWHPMASTGAVAIPDGSYGPGYRGDTLVVQGSGLAVGDRVRPTPNAFTAEQDRRGLWIVQAIDNGIALIVKETHSGLYAVKTTTSVTKRSGATYGSGTCEFYTDGFASGAFSHNASGEAYPVYNMAEKEEIAINTFLQVTVRNGDFVAVWEECP